MSVAIEMGQSGPGCEWLRCKMLQQRGRGGVLQSGLRPEDGWMGTDRAEKAVSKRCKKASERAY